MALLKLLVISILFQVLPTVTCVDRKVNIHGFFEPKIERVFIPPGQILDPTKPSDKDAQKRTETVKAEEILMKQLLTSDFDKIPLVTHFDPQFKFGAKFKEKYNFRLYKFSSENSKQMYYVVQLHSDSNTPSKSETRAYWSPQGAYVDIPVYPKSTDAKYLFTPTFSGCTLVVDLIEKPVIGGEGAEKYYRVYHVQGKKEDAEYNKLKYHGLGMLLAMEYRDYGYFRPDKKKPNLYVENRIGSAFMGYDNKEQRWVLYHQSQFGPNGYLVVSKILDENGKTKITAAMPIGTMVAKTNLLSVKTPVCSEGRVANNVFVCDVHKGKGKEEL